MLSYLWKLVRKWYVAVAAIFGLFDTTDKVAKSMGQPLPDFRFPSWAVVVFVLAAVFYGAYSLHKEAIEEGRAKGKAEALAEGDLRADLMTEQTNAYPSDGKNRLYLFLYLKVRSSGSSAVKLTRFRLVDELRQEYQPIPKTELLRTIGGQVALGPGNYFGPARLVFIEPNKPTEVVAILATEKPNWPRVTKRMSYTLTIEDDHGRTASLSFACPVQYFERI